jgi:glyoxylate/succinic semialdehyde reductase
MHCPHTCRSIGAGQTFRSNINKLVLLAVAAVRCCLQLGLQQKDVVEVVGLGAIACPMFALKGPAMVQGNYPTAFPLKHQQKDMRLALAAADTAAQPLTVAAAANQAYIKARQLGQGDADFSAVMLAVLEQQRSSKAH